MSSYVAVTGVPTGETCSIFGLTPQEIRYLQSKFPDSLKHHHPVEAGAWSPSAHPAHGIRLSCACTVILNALGFIGFKVISTSGDRQEYLWTMERNLDHDCAQFQSPDYETTRYHSASSLQHRKSMFSISNCGGSNSAGTTSGGSGGPSSMTLQLPKDKESRRHSIGGKIASVFANKN